jgi:hypothetical protein
MSITVQCSCGAKLRAKESHAGRTLACPKCNEPLEVPKPQSPHIPAPTPNDFDFETSEPPTLPAPTPPSSPLPATSIGKLPTYLSAAALLISAAVAAKVFLTDPLGAGLGAYDFTTPKAALTSELQVSVARDVRAQLDLAQLKSGKAEQEKLNTVKIERESDYQGKKILFISYQENGLPKYGISAFEKHTDTGYWLPVYISSYSISDSALEKAVNDWEAKSGSDPD